VSLPDTMRAMVTMGHGGFDKLDYRTDWPRPDPGPGEVLIKVGACGLNNTDINTREGWYSKAVTGPRPAARPAGEAPGGRGSVLGRRAHRLSAHPGCRRLRPDRGRRRRGRPARIGERVITDNWLRDPDDLTRQDEDRLFRVRARWRLRGIHHDAGPECAGGEQPAVGRGARDILLLLLHRRGHADPRPRDLGPTRS
jgi:hypothetical protein